MFCLFVHDNYKHISNYSIHSSSAWLAGRYISAILWFSEPYVCLANMLQIVSCVSVVYFRLKILAMRLKKTGEIEYPHSSVSFSLISLGVMLRILPVIVLRAESEINPEESSTGTAEFTYIFFINTEIKGSKKTWVNTCKWVKQV